MNIEQAGPSEQSDEEFYCTPEEVKNEAKMVTLNLLPNKSKQKYELQYSQFMEWCALKQIKRYSENVILTYLSELSKKYKASTLWSIHSMLKATLSVKHDVDIKTYTKVNAFLKKQSTGYVAKKSKTFDLQEIENFLVNAPDEIYLMAKVRF